MTLRCPVQLAASAAPSVTKSGAKCSVRGWASCPAGDLCSKSSRASTSWASQRPVAPVVELRRPAGHPAARVPQGGQVVGEEAAADDQHALVAQRGELAPDVHQLLRVERRHGDLEYGDVGVREHLHQRDVRPVVEAPVRDVLDGRTGAAQQLADAVGELRGAGGARTAPGSSARGSPRSRRPAGRSRWRRARAGPPPSGRRPSGSRWGGAASADQAASWPGQTGSSASGGAPWREVEGGHALRGDSHGTPHPLDLQPRHRRLPVPGDGSQALRIERHQALEAPAESHRPGS